MTTLIDYALMAGASYIDTRALINRFPAPEGWLMSNHQSKDSGFEAVTFKNGTEIVISFAGTYDKDLTGDCIQWNHHLPLRTRRIYRARPHHTFTAFPIDIDHLEFKGQ